MTKEQFISGVSFRVKSNSNYVGAPTFKYEGDCVIQETRSSLPSEELLFSRYHCNIIRVGKVAFQGFVYILHEKKVNIRYKFEDLIEFVAGE